MRGKAKVSLIVLEILIALGILAIPLFWAYKIAWAASTGKAMMTYREGVVNIPRYRIWTGSSWGDEKTDAQDVGGDSYWCVLRSCPKRNEKILGILDNNQDVNVQVWDGSAWGNLQQLTDDTGLTSKRCFDIAYEQSSGDALVVFGVNTITTPKYSSWDGSAWGAGGNCAAIGSGDVEWVAMASKPGADEIVLVTQDANKDIYAQVWDGSSWGNAVVLTTNTDVTIAKSFDVAYEQLNKRAIIVYTVGSGDYDTPLYSIWDNGAWGTGGSCGDRITGYQRLVKMAAKPGSNEIMEATLDALNDINVEIWYSAGTTSKETAQWSHRVEVETDAVPSETAIHKRCYDVAYESSSGDGIIVWSANTDTAKYSPWDGSTWGAGGSANAPASGGIVHWVALASNPDTDEIMLMTINAVDGTTQYNDEVNVQKWSGSGWGSISAVETASYSQYEGMAIDYDKHSSQVSIIIQKWRELYQ